MKFFDKEDLRTYTKEQLVELLKTDVSIVTGKQIGRAHV